ncbi:MAG: hypothetical protein DRG71_03990 [Deltaproteobacteria bacterium]|nr:MAG: hypothetical protein DRG71_03990 [Deltaproteobacteria bacterium]
MRLDLRFTPRAPYALWCEAVVGFVCKDLFFKDEAVPGIDQKTSAYLRSLNKRGFFKAEPGETLLLPGEDRLRADKVILKGLGLKEDMTLESFLGHASDVAFAIRSLGIHNFAVRIPMLFGVEQYQEQIKRTVQEMMPRFMVQEVVRGPSVITAVFSVERAALEIIQKVEDSLKEYFGEGVPVSLVTEPSARTDEI